VDRIKRFCSARNIGAFALAGVLSLCACTSSTEEHIQPIHPNEQGQLGPKFTYPEGERPGEASPQQKCDEKIADLLSIQYGYDDPAFMYSLFGQFVSDISGLYQKFGNQISLPDGSILNVPTPEADNRQFSNEFLPLNLPDGCRVYSGNYTYRADGTIRLELNVGAKSYTIIISEKNITLDDGTGLPSEVSALLRAVVADVANATTAPQITPNDPLLVPQAPLNV
jgi:hypothetical protein